MWDYFEVFDVRLNIDEKPFFSEYDIWLAYFFTVQFVFFSPRYFYYSAYSHWFFSSFNMCDAKTNIECGIWKYCAFRFIARKTVWIGKREIQINRTQVENIAICGNKRTLLTVTPQWVVVFGKRWRGISCVVRFHPGHELRVVSIRCSVVASSSRPRFWPMKVISISRNLNLCFLLFVPK